jgi:DNA-binding NtrC family response regulator
MTRKHILIVDDEKGIRQSLTGVLEDDGLRISTGWSFWNAFASATPLRWW